MISVLSSLVLGLLIATAKNSYDTTASAVRTYAAELALLNETLRDYGGDAARPRDFLREYTERLRDDIWPTARCRAIRSFRRSAPDTARLPRRWRCAG